MNKETLKKGKILYNRLISLAYNRDDLINAKDITDINITIDTGNYECKYVKVNIEYLDFDKLKTFLLEEINREIAKTQKEFDEL